MALTLNDIGTRQNYSSTGTTQSVTLTTGVDLLVVRHVNRDNGDVVTAMTYNGDALTKLGSQGDSGSGFAAIWYKIAPTGTGTAHNLVITLDGSSHRCSFDWLGYTGANQSTPLGTLAATSGSSTSMSRTITDGVTGDSVIDLGYIFQSPNAPGSVAVTGGQTIDANGALSTASTDPYMVSSHVAGAASVTPGWSWTTTLAFAYLAVDVKAAAAVVGSRNRMLLGVG